MSGPPLGALGLADLDVLRLVLRGSSVVDWFRLHMEAPEDVDGLLRVNELDPSDPLDRDRLLDLRDRALAYLEQHLRYRRIADAAKDAAPRDLFLLASGKGRRRDRLSACMLLKVMHILNYQDGHELLSRLPMSAAEVGILLRAKVERMVRGLLNRRFPVVDFAGNTKTNDSVLSKLLAKRDTQATKVFDKLRFRLITERIEDIPCLLRELTRELMPFNYLVPGQSDNSLLDLELLLQRAGNVAGFGRGADVNEPPESPRIGPKNEFSGPTYRVVSFVTEVPVRIDRAIPLEDQTFDRLGRVVFGTVEFQIADVVSHEVNESGDNRHALYKGRQRSRVRQRLQRARRAPGA